MPATRLRGEPVCVRACVCVCVRSACVWQHSREWRGRAHTSPRRPHESLFACTAAEVFSHALQDRACIAGARLGHTAHGHTVARLRARRTHSCVRTAPPVLCVRVVAAAQRRVCRLMQRSCAACAARCVLLLCACSGRKVCLRRAMTVEGAVAPQARDGHAMSRLAPGMGLSGQGRDGARRWAGGERWRLTPGCVQVNAC